MRIAKQIESPEGNSICFLQNELHNKVLVIGVFHGDEPQGKFLIEEYLKQTPNSKLSFVPCLNPDGMGVNKGVNKRVNSNGVDLNRNFPTQNWELTEKNEFFGGTSPASEVETVFIKSIVEEMMPEVILTLHAPFKVVNYDGDAAEIAEKISKIINYPTEASIGYPTPGSFGTWAGVERKIPTITLELDEEIDVKLLEKPVFEIFSMLEDY